jgi:imidazolonepropionase-like amidohydrolase
VKAGLHNSSHSLVLSFALFMVSIGWSPAVAQDDAARTLAIVGGFLIDGNEGPPIRDAVILVEGDRIVHVGTVADTPIPLGAEVVDANGYTVMPGLHDVHVHLMIAGHGVYDEYFPRWGDRLREIMPISARQLLEAGVTSARDVGAPLAESIWIKNEIEAGRIPGPRVFVSGPFLQKTTSGYDDAFRWTVDGPADARAKTRQLIDAGVDLIKVIQLAQLTAGERQAIAEEAHRAGVHIAVHAWSLPEHQLAAEMGAATIEHVSAGSKPRFREESVRLFAEQGIAYVESGSARGHLRGCP